MAVLVVVGAPGADDCTAGRGGRRSEAEGVGDRGGAEDGNADEGSQHGAGHLPGGAAEVDASASSQFVSGLLLAAPRYDRGVRLRHTGAGPGPSAPQGGMTVHMLRSAGAPAGRGAPAGGRPSGRRDPPQRKAGETGE